MVSVCDNKKDAQVLLDWGLQTGEAAEKAELHIHISHEISVSR